MVEVWTLKVLGFATVLAGLNIFAVPWTLRTGEIAISILGTYFFVGIGAMLHREWRKERKVRELRERQS